MTAPNQQPLKGAVLANQRLELSQLDPNVVQQGLMGDDLDLEKLTVYLKSQILFDAVDRIIDVQVERTIDAASTVTITLNDYDRSIVQSGALNARLDIQLDGLWFRMVKVSRNAGEDNLSLTFEQREIAILRTYPLPFAPHNGVKFAHRTKVTRAQFILNLIREVKEFDIPVVIPHLLQAQPIQKLADAGINWNIPTAGAGASGIQPDYNDQQQGVISKATGKSSYKYLTVKNVRATKEQLRNANTIIATGVSLKANRKVIICSIMTAIQESVLQNLSGGDGTSVGLFQQIDTGWGSYDDRHDPATAAGSFIKRCIDEDKKYPGLSFNDLCQNVQRSGHPDLYGQWRWEAQRLVNAYGLPPGTATGDETATGGTGGTGGSSAIDEIFGTAADANNMGDMTFTGPEDYVYYRGKPKQSGKVWEREDNWTCITRLANEVGWRAFFIGGVFYYLTDDDLYKSQPILTVTEDSPGVQGIGFDYDVGKLGATVDIPCQCGLWSAPPGAIIVVNGCGFVDGRWLVNSFTRSVFSSDADIALSKPQPVLPEPATESEKMPSWAKVQQGGGGQTPAQQGITGQVPAPFSGPVRNQIVNICKKAAQINEKYKWHYAEIRPMPASLWSAEAHSRGIDCSGFATLVYREAGCDDPNGLGYNGSGYTGTLASHGNPIDVNTLRPGDLVFYGDPPNYGHVVVFVGDGQVIGIGGDPGVHQLDMNYRPVTACRSYLL